MKNIYIVLSFVFISISSVAQNNDTKTADKLFDRYEYVSAAKEYLKLAEGGKSNGYVYKQLADCYYNMFNAAQASKWYAKAIESNQDAETYFRYAQMLKANGKYDDANKQMQKFASLAPNDSRAKEFMANQNYVPKLLSKNVEYTVKPIDINSDKSDFGPVLYGNTFYFASARNNLRKNYGWKNEPFLDIYKATLNDSGVLSEPTTADELNTKFNDGTFSMTADGNTAYFSTESYKDKAYEKPKKDKISFIYLYKATKTGEKWDNIKLLPLNSNQFSTGNPSITRDGKTLYFASNRPGGIGGTDIWKVSVNGDGTYGTPENLGAKVNTEGSENFPFIADDNKTLYFASSGKSGLGGYDVYKVDLSGASEAINMGKPVNSEKDDFGFTFNKDKNFGFLASNRVGEDDNIYMVTPICGVDVITTVTNAKTGAILPGAKVSILDAKKNIISTETSDENGIVKFRVECDKDYGIQASKDGFEGNSFPLAKSKGPEAKIAAKLNPIDVIVTPTEIILKPIYFEYNKSNITQDGAFELDKLVQVMKNNDKLVIMAKSHTDSRGSDTYNLDLSERRAKSTVQYIISKGIDPSRISGKGFGETEPKVVCGENCTEEQHAQNRRSEFLIVN